MPGQLSFLTSPDASDTPLERMRIRADGSVEIVDPGGTDYAAFSHDGTDFNTAFTTTADWNISGLTGFIDVLDGIGLRIRNSDNADYLEMWHDDTDFSMAFTNTGDLNVSSLTGNVWVRDGAGLKISDSTDADFAIFSHDGDDFLTAFTSTTDWNITGARIVPEAITTPSEVVTTTNVITAAEAGTTYYLNAAGGFTSTLPAPAVGLKYRFVVKTAPTTAYVLTTDAGANVLYGTINEITTTAGISVQAQDTLNFVASVALIGDWIEVESDATNWYIHGVTQVDDGITASVT